MLLSVFIILPVSLKNDCNFMSYSVAAFRPITFIYFFINYLVILILIPISIINFN